MKVFAEGARAGEVPLPEAHGAQIFLSTKAAWNLEAAKANGGANLDNGLVAINSRSPPKPRRKVHRQLPVTVPGFVPIALDSNDSLTVAKGYQSRLLRDTPRPQVQLLEELTSFVQSWLKTHVRKVQPMGFEEWLSSTSYDEGRKAELRNAHASLRGGLPRKHDARKISSFVKTEGYDSYKNARLINSRGDKFKAFSGPAVKAIEQELYQQPEYVKHVPVPERPSKVEALVQDGLKYYSTDYTAFESHFTVDIMEALELQLYRHCLSGWAGLKLLCDTIAGENRMRTRAGVTAAAFAKRMSGEMTTSLANGFSNHMLTLFIVHKKGGILHGLVEGDDGLWATDVDLDKSDYEALGFTIKIIRVQDPRTASFCGLIYAKEGEIMRDPRHFFANFGWTSSMIHAGDTIMKQLLRAKALSTLHETPACPLVSELARLALERTAGVVPRFIEDGFHKIPSDTRSLVAREPSLETRELFAQLFGITPEAQLLCEQHIRAGRLDQVAQLLPPTSDMSHYFSRYVTTG